MSYEKQYIRKQKHLQEPARNKIVWETVAYSNQAYHDNSHHDVQCRISRKDGRFFTEQSPSPHNHCAFFESGEVGRQSSGGGIETGGHRANLWGSRADWPANPVYSGWYDCVENKAFVTDFASDSRRRVPLLEEAVKICYDRHAKTIEKREHLSASQLAT